MAVVGPLTIRRRSLLLFSLVPAAAAFVMTPIQPNWDTLFWSQPHHPEEDGSSSPRRAAARRRRRSCSRRRAAACSMEDDSPAKRSMDHSSHDERIRTTLRLDNGRTVAIVSRTLPLAHDWNVTIYEMDRPAAVVEQYWKLKHNDGRLLLSSPQQQSRTQDDNNDDDLLLDPFGFVSWPGAVVAAQELQNYQTQIQNATVLILGAGPGGEALAFAMLGAKHVLATDIHPMTLQLLRHGAKQAGFRDDTIETQVLDIFSDEELPSTDIVILADVMYDESLGRQVGRRIYQLLQRTHPPKILVSDSQRFTDFLPDLNQQLLQYYTQPPHSSSFVPLVWETRELERFTGSGVLLDDDQTYEVHARVLLIGWD